MRAFSADAMMIARQLVDRRHLMAGIERLLASPRAVHLHIHFAHFAAAGCYAARAERA